MLVSSGWKALRLAAKASQIIKTNMITAVIEIRDPTEEIVFHRV